MKFSLFFEMQIADSTRDSERGIFLDSLEQAILADELGYHGIWAVEHHGLYEYSHSTAPEVFLSFAAARTKSIRIGHGVSLTAKAYAEACDIHEFGGIISPNSPEIAGSELQRHGWTLVSNFCSELAANYGRAGVETIGRMWVASLD